MNANENSLIWQQVAERAHEVNMAEGGPEECSWSHCFQAETELKAESEKVEGLAQPNVSLEGVREPLEGASVRGALPVPEIQEVKPDPVPGTDSPENTGRPVERSKATGNRDSIREITHPVMGSRQSERVVERSNLRRQPKRGRGSQHPHEQLTTPHRTLDQLSFSRGALDAVEPMWHLAR